MVSFENRRVKTPTLFLVVKRYLENVKFVPTKFFIPKIKIETENALMPYIMAQYDGKFEKYEDFQKIIATLYSQKTELVEISTEKNNLLPNCTIWLNYKKKQIQCMVLLQMKL